MQIRFKFILTIVILFQLSCKNISADKKMDSPSIKSKTTLDSLQGYWVSIDDSLWSWKITGKTIDEKYKGDESADKFYRIYFSDTLVTTETFNEIKIDTNSVSGEYLITNDVDNTAWCYEIYGFNTDSSGTTVSLASTWAFNRPQVFRKIQ